MAEITKITTPMVPNENLGNRNKPISDQAFDLNDPTKVHRNSDQGKIQDHQRDGQAALRDGVGREMLAPILKDVNELLYTLHKITMMVQMGISASDLAQSQEVQELLDSLFLTSDQLLASILEQDNASVLFKGNAFELLRDVMSKFPDNPRVQNAVTELLKVFEHNVNTENSVRTILITCNNLLDYMFSGDRQQFSQYLEGLTDLLLPETASQEADKAGPDGRQEGLLRELGVEHKEASQILKGNLLPLLGEIVVKYNQNERIRDMVMVVVHNIVRVDQGSPEALREAIAKLIAELKQLANLPEGFEQQLSNALLADKEKVMDAQNSTLARLASLLTEALSSPETNPATLRQAELLLLSLLQNQNSVMDLLHFILPMETPNGKLYGEMYVDPDSDEKVGKSKEKSRKLFIAFETESLGAFEFSFLESAERVDFHMWCPERYVSGLGGMKRQIGDIMQLHGYTMNSYQVAELVEPHTIADVFPKLLNRRLGVDVRA